MTFFRVASSITLILVLGAGSWAKDQGKGRDKQGGRAETNVAVVVDIFLGSDQATVREYVSAYQGRGLPPGLAKRRDLPPGLEKQLRRKGKLPPGLQKRLAAFPPSLEERLSVLKPGLKRGFIEGRAVIYNAKTSVILDVFVPF